MNKDNQNAIDVLINNIQKDQALLASAEAQIEKAKEQKREVVARLKDYRKDVLVFMKYVDANRRKQIESLGLDLSDSEHHMNGIATFVMDTIMKAKDYQMTNGKLYDAYVKSCKDVEPVSYTEFNIKCRSLFSSQRLLRNKNAGSNNSKEDTISLNGRPMPKETSKTETK